MTRCPGKSLACLGGQTRPYRDPLDHQGRIFMACAECIAALNAMGAGYVEVEAGPLTTRILEVRTGTEPESRWQPVWLRHLTGRDETGRNVA